MGGDTPPELLAQALASSEEGASCIPFASPQIVHRYFPNKASVACTEVIEMHENPSCALRSKPHASVRQGLLHLKKGNIAALISACNTGALLLAARTIIKTCPSISRPALLVMLPTRARPLAVIDVGAHPTCQPRHILQFARMGLAYQKSHGVPHPTVGLLNMGSEATKGHPQAREAYTALSQLNQHRPIFVGNIEGHAALQGNVDVLVTDGFTGNIFLKSIEGVVRFLCQETFGGLCELPGGAVLCGLNHLVIKCHGHVTPSSLLQAVRMARLAIQNRLVDNFIDHLTHEFARTSLVF